MKESIKALEEWLGTITADVWTYDKRIKMQRAELSNSLKHREKLLTQKHDVEKSLGVLRAVENLKDAKE